MAEFTSEHEYFHFPAEVWLRIAVLLDVESLQALQESHVIPWDVCDEPMLSRTTTLSPHSDASALLRYLQRCRARSVNILRLTGCLAAVPNKVFQSISVCAQLAELYCVNCILCPWRLFNIVTSSLPQLTQLEWSLFEEHTYGERLDIGAFENRTAPKLRHMYVEVAGGPESCDVLQRIKQCCVSLEHLHVHALRRDQWELLLAGLDLDDPNQMLESFAYTSHGFPENVAQAHALAQELRMSLPFFSISCATFGNITYYMRPTLSCTRVHLKGIIASPERAIPEEELIFCVECCRSAPAQLATQAGRPWVRRLRSLTFVLLPSADWRDIRCRCHYVSLTCSWSVSTFLCACTNLTELNLSLVHFEPEADFCQLFPPGVSSRLRAIALLQCGLQTTASVHSLAVSCAMLEELDVRGGHGWSVGGSECHLCSLHFMAINRETVSALHRRTRLQRLTLCCFRGLQCCRLLTVCRLVHLRLSWPERSTTCCNGRSFVECLGSSEHLRSLTLNCPKVPLNVICSELGYAGILRLRTLCIVSGVELSDCAQESISELTRRLPLLETVHGHYLGEDHYDHSVTWIRCWRLGFPDVRVDMEEGVFLPNAPCSRDCSMTTFIGLKKPRH